ncbi:hypothetical protein J3E74DRAFT_475114 [Bipolaris maydis]|nr:hypothetical protein J3E74DRAFT_475114 [Bipolaris maydis]KAJ6282354.1 hypothetical protein J3E71DRAFT_398822 [Bipolaris maydis]
MAYNQSTHSHMPPWSPENSRNQNNPFDQPPAVSSSAESPLQMATVSELTRETQSWHSQTCACATPSHETYIPTNSFQQPIPKQNTPHSTAFPSTTYTTLRFQHTPTANSPSPQTRLPYYYEPSSTNSIAIYHPPQQPPLPSSTSTTIPCPYHCGTILTGAHALGNLTRHLKTQACTGPARGKQKYKCASEGCERVYARSDGLRVHVRRVHGG